MCMNVLTERMCSTCMPGTPGRWKKVLDPLKLDLQTVVSHHVGDGD